MGDRLSYDTFWRSKRVLITGYTGFKGSWLSLWLNSMGAQVYGLALEPKRGCLFERANLGDYVDGVFADIRDFDSVASNLLSFEPEIIFHLAAQPLIRDAYKNPVKTFHTNVIGTAHVLEAARKVGSVKSIINVTTDKCYQNNEWLWGYREEDRLGGRDPYSASKACVEILSNAYSKSFFEPTGICQATVRAGNVIGGGDFAIDRLIPDLLIALETNSPLRVRFPDAVRPWQHVLEPLAGYILLAERLYNGQQDFVGAWNFGPVDQDCRTVAWLIDEFCTHWGSKPDVEILASEIMHEATMLKLDSSKARALLGWQPKWSLPEALRKIVDWHKSQQVGDNLTDLCLRQIAEYNNQTVSGE